MNDMPVPGATASRAGISETERARRRAAIAYARGSVRLEGFVASDFAESLNERFINGEITRAELTAALKRHHGL
jgi:Antitoxin VbhA